MAEYKKQHIVPRSYLARFSDANGVVHRIDINEARKVHHKSQNRKDNFYTAENRKNFEKELSSIEESFSKLIKEVDFATKKENFFTSLKQRNLIISMLHLYARVNPKRNNHLQLSGGAIKGYSMAESILIVNIFTQQMTAVNLLLNPSKKEIKVGAENFEEQLYYCTLKLSVTLIRSSSRYLITSDNPMCFFSDQYSGEIFGYLPLNPNEALFIFNRQKFIPVKNLTRSGVEILNNFQKLNANKCIFTSPNDSRKDCYDFKNTRSAHSKFASSNDKLFGSRLLIGKGLDFIFMKNNHPLDMPTYEVACRKLGKDVVINYEDKTININTSMNLDELWCFMRLSEIREHLSKNPPPK